MPLVLQRVLSGWQVSGVPLQVPLQQAPLDVHVWPSETQVVEQTPATQLRLQQSVPSVQLEPLAEHIFCCVQVLLTGSQTPEQHVALVVQAAP